MVRFEIEAEMPRYCLQAVQNLFAVKLNDIVMRYLVNRLNSKATLEYQRPESLEDIPGKTTDSLTKDHKFKADPRHNIASPQDTAAATTCR